MKQACLDLRAKIVASFELATHELLCIVSKTQLAEQEMLTLVMGLRVLYATWELCLAYPDDN